MEKTVSADNRALARYIRERFGEKVSVNSYLDELEKNSLDILTCLDSPFEHITSVSTIGLSDHPIGLLDENNIHLGVEFVGACDSSFTQFDLILSTCGFNIINSHFKCRPGIIFKDVVTMYCPDFQMKHILFGPPFGWQQEFETQYFPTKTVAWLLTIPISDSEMKYADQFGVDALEDLFEKQQIDTYDLNRKSVL
jgi:hypothetical protein